MFLLKFGAQYTMGAINHPTFGEARRELIKRKFPNNISLHTSDAIRNSPLAQPLTQPRPISPFEPLSSMARALETPHKEMIIGATKLLLRAAAVALLYAPIPYLVLIPTTLLTWIGIYEVRASL